MSCVQKMQSQTGNKPQVKERKKEIREGPGLQQSCQMNEEKSCLAAEGSGSFFPRGGGNHQDPGDAERTDCFPVALLQRGSSGVLHPSVVCWKICLPTRKVHGFRDGLHLEGVYFH